MFCFIRNSLHFLNFYCINLLEIFQNLYYWHTREMIISHPKIRKQIIIEYTQWIYSSRGLTQFHRRSTTLNNPQMSLIKLGRFRHRCLYQLIEYTNKIIDIVLEQTSYFLVTYSNQIDTPCHPHKPRRL